MGGIVGIPGSFRLSLVVMDKPAGFSIFAACWGREEGADTSLTGMTATAF